MSKRFESFVGMISSLSKEITRLKARLEKLQSSAAKKPAAKKAAAAKKAVAKKSAAKKD